MWWEMDKSDKEMFINKRIKYIYLDGYCVELVLEDNTKLEYDATDGGYTSYTILKEMINK